MIDFHCHSTFSDGLLTPEALVGRAVEASIKMLALTDHDTTLGLASLRAAALSSGLAIVNGIELSTRWKTHDIHVVGLQIDPEHKTLQACIEAQTQSRNIRAIAMGHLLSPYVKDAYQKARALAGHERVSRPHFAEVLVKEGVVRDMATAFKRYLGRGRTAYVVTEWVSLPDVVRVIQESGGLAVLAHPLKYKLTRTKLNALICAFKEAGGAGIEVISGLMTSTEINQIATLCNDQGLLASSGSDFHGDMVSRVALGRQAVLPDSCTPIWEQWGLH